MLRAAVVEDVAAALLVAVVAEVVAGDVALLRLVAEHLHNNSWKFSSVFRNWGRYGVPNFFELEDRLRIRTATITLPTSPR